jgi:hypothetical protein
MASLNDKFKKNILATKYQNTTIPAKQFWGHYGKE